MIKKVTENEIDLLELIIIIWKKKIKVLSITFAILAIVMVYELSQTKKSIYVASTEIRPISTFQEFKYETYNSYINQTVNLKNYNKVDEIDYEKDDEKDDLKITETELLNEEDINFKKINKSYLLTLFIEKLSENQIFVDGIKKFNFLQKENFKNEKAYEDAVKQLASSIKLIPPDNFSKRDAKEKYWRISFQTSDTNKWNDFLKYIEQPTNDEIKLYLNSVFNELILNEKKLKRFQLEDLELKIENAYLNYDRKINRRLVFLKEQSKIARKLEIPRNNLIEGQSFATDTGIIANLRTAIPYYMRGYEMIEKEIELIENRTDKKAFTDGLNKLEQKRTSLISNKDLNRLETLFGATPIATNENFNAANVMYLTTKYSEINKKNYAKMAIMSVILGLIFAILYVLIENGVKNRK